MNAEIKPIKTAAEQALAARYEAAKTSLPGGPEIGRLREQAFLSFAADGLPHRRVEEWKYTDLRALMKDAKPLAAAPGKADIELGSIDDDECTSHGDDRGAGERRGFRQDSDAKRPPDPDAG